MRCLDVLVPFVFSDGTTFKLSKYLVSLLL